MARLLDFAQRLDALEGELAALRKAAEVAPPAPRAVCVRAMVTDIHEKQGAFGDTRQQPLVATLYVFPADKDDVRGLLELFSKSRPTGVVISFDE